uniref:CSON004488 protein n=1 Tax=Culicoides sonorensis TaxID=179676 RepID=A0A336KDR3_CULSO
MNQFLQGIGILLPFISLLLVGILSIAKILLFIRRKFPITVNCWFCNKYEKLPYDSRNSFICSGCQQYNGFTKDGDYNRPIPEMFYSKLNPVTNCVFSEENVYALKKSNGLCYNCNRNQELMILQLASFVPDNDENFDEEVEKYRQNLEKSYRLCAQCERVVKRSLNQVKSHIVGSKMTKLSEKMNQNREISSSSKLKIIKIGVHAIFVITVINFFVSLNGFTISGDKLIKTFGNEIGEKLLSGISYVLAVKSLVVELILRGLDNPILQGAYIYLTSGIENLQTLTGTFDYQNLLSSIDFKEFFNISTMLITVMLIILLEGQHLMSQLALLFFCSLKTLLHNHEMLLEPLDTDFIHVLDLICVFMALILSYHNSSKSQVTFKYSDNLNRSFHKICPEIEDEESDHELDDTYSDSCSNLLNSTLKSQSGEFVRNGSFYHNPDYSRPPSVFSTSFKSPSELLNTSRISTKNVMDNVGKLTQLNINHTLNNSMRSFKATSVIENPFYNHINLDRQTPSSVISYRSRNVISPPKLNHDTVSEASWVAGGFWTSPKKSTLPANSDFMPIISRTSSQSSGFESQPGMGSRENSVEKDKTPKIMNNTNMRPIRPHPVYAGQAPSFNGNASGTGFLKPISRMDNSVLSPSRISLTSRQSNRSLFDESHFNDTSSLYNYRSNGRFVTPTSPLNNSSRSIFNFKKFRTDLPNL